jgi:methionyl-tRNA synthetase
MRRVLEICRVAAVLLSPVCPDKARELGDKLQMGELSLEGLGTLDGLEEGKPVAAGDPLFPRMMELPAQILAMVGDGPAEAPAQTAPKKKKSKQKKSAPAAEDAATIGFEDFTKVRMVAGRVLGAEKHPDADRLLVVSVDVGEDEPRTVVAGIAARYAPEELVGQTVVAVVNLAPAKLRGVVSQGMLLAAGGKKIQALVTLSEDVAPGTEVR